MANLRRVDELAMLGELSGSSFLGRQVYMDIGLDLLFCNIICLVDLLACHRT